MGMVMASAAAACLRGLHGVSTSALCINALRIETTCRVVEAAPWMLCRRPMDAGSTAWGPPASPPLGLESTRPISSIGSPCMFSGGMLPRNVRVFSSGSDLDIDKEVAGINDLFVEAREEIEYAMEDAETTYFNESCETAREAVEKVMTAWQALLAAAAEEEAAKLQRSMGLKMEQLKAELQKLEELHA